MNDNEIDPSTGEQAGDVENDFEAWARLSARLMDLPAEQRDTVLEDLELVDDWVRIDEHWSELMTQELRSGDPSKVCRHGELCAEELERREAERIPGVKSSASPRSSVAAEQPVVATLDDSPGKPAVLGVPPAGLGSEPEPAPVPRHFGKQPSPVLSAPVVPPAVAKVPTPPHPPLAKPPRVEPPLAEPPLVEPPLAVEPSSGQATASRLEAAAPAADDLADEYGPLGQTFPLSPAQQIAARSSPTPFQRRSPRSNSASASVSTSAAQGHPATPFERPRAKDHEPAKDAVVAQPVREQGAAETGPMGETLPLSSEQKRKPAPTAAPFKIAPTAPQDGTQQGAEQPHVGMPGAPWNQEDGEQASPYADVILPADGQVDTLGKDSPAAPVPAFGDTQRRVAKTEAMQPFSAQPPVPSSVSREPESAPAEPGVEQPEGMTVKLKAIDAEGAVDESASDDETETDDQPEGMTVKLKAIDDGA